MFRQRLAPEALNVASTSGITQLRIHGRGIRGPRPLARRPLRLRSSSPIFLAPSSVLARSGGEGNGSGAPEAVDAIEVSQLTAGDEAVLVAKIRADAYYEDQPTRFLDTFKKQFAEAEVRSLLQRTGLDGRGQGSCVCLFARLDGEIVGTLDIYVPLGAKAAPGVPNEDPTGAYVNNVCVDKEHRRQGVARALMVSARRLCGDRSLASVYVHVDADNEAALALYQSLGFRETGQFTPGIGGSTIGRRLVLRLELP